MTESVPVRFVEAPVVVLELDFATIGSIQVTLQRARRQPGHPVDPAGQRMYYAIIS